ncbi:MAG TPA: hypothetical protein VFH87_15835 [Candidatus Udaeobacter sp.]|nr:hypothetical protein [Candidatus Udaeobacter sp.]
MSRTKSSARSVPVIYQPRYIRWILSLMARTHLPLLLIALALVAVVLTQERRRRRLGWLAALVLLGYLYNAAACVEVAVIQSLDVRRFITVQMFLTLLAQFFALWFVLEFALEMRACAKSSFPEAPDAKDINDGALGVREGADVIGAATDHTTSARFCSEPVSLPPDGFMELDVQSSSSTAATMHAIDRRERVAPWPCLTWMSYSSSSASLFCWPALVGW